MLSPEILPLFSKHAVPRIESDGVLLFQVVTDEMHYISKGAYTIFLLCDGTRTVAEIEDYLALHQPELGTAAGKERIEHFLTSLADRNLIELWRHEL